MKAADINATLIDGYLRLLEGLSHQGKLDLIDRLKKSVSFEKDMPEAPFYRSFGAWNSKGSAEALIEQIRSARTATPDRETL
jgi:hypothetical protein